jgi:hypothetical protein
MKTGIRKNSWFKSLLCALLCIATCNTALAQRVHLIGEPTFEDLGENLEACLTLAGLGNKDITIMLTVTGTASVTYVNPGKNVPPGQNKIPIKLLTWEFIPSDQIKNGTVSVCLTSPDVTLEAAPNPNWSVELDDVEFETATITVIQKGRVALKMTVQL